MIIIIILIVLSVLWLIPTIISFKDDDDALGFSVMFGIHLIALFFCSIWCLGENIKSSVDTKKYELQETVILLQNKKTVIESYHTISNGNKTEFTSDITLETLSTSDYYQLVESYNKEVFDFKVDVVSHQNNRNNAWISWFHSPAYSVISLSDLDNLTYTIGK